MALLSIPVPMLPIVALKAVCAKHASSSCCSVVLSLTATEMAVRVRARSPTLRAYLSSAPPWRLRTGGTSVSEKGDHTPPRRLAWWHDVFGLLRLSLLSVAKGIVAIVMTPIRVDPLFYFARVSVVFSLSDIIFILPL